MLFLRDWFSLPAIGELNAHKAANDEAGNQLHAEAWVTQLVPRKKGSNPATDGKPTLARGRLGVSLAAAVGRSLGRAPLKALWLRLGIGGPFDDAAAAAAEEEEEEEKEEVVVGAAAEVTGSGGATAAARTSSEGVVIDDDDEVAFAAASSISFMKYFR